MWKGSSLICDLGNFSLLCHSVRLRMPRMEILVTTLTPLFSCGSSQLLPGTSSPPRSNCLLAPFSLELFAPSLFVPSWAHTFQASLPASRSCPPHPKTSPRPCGLCHIRTLPQVDFLLIPPCLLWLHCYLSLSCLTLLVKFFFFHDHASFSPWTRFLSQTQRFSWSLAVLWKQLGLRAVQWPKSAC